MMQTGSIFHAATLFSLLSLLKANKCHVSISNVALNGHVFASFHADNMHVCYERCQEKIGCLSINYYRDSFTCELNNRTIAVKSRMKEFNFNAVYFERIKPAAIGSQEEIPAESCMEIKITQHPSISGFYWVKHAQQTAKIYCNMTTGASEPCISSKCQNQGKCNKVNEISYNCTCVSPFYGKNCENKLIDYCSPPPCVNGGTCVNGQSTFSCTCKVGFTGKTCSTVNDAACSSYTTITDSTRLMTSGISAKKCDSTIAVKWYRFSGGAGVRMPTSCVPKSRCNTDATGWLSQPHPSVEQGIVSKKVCFNWSSNCCSWNKYIRVRNCGSFYVYEFKPSPACSLRYCSTN